MKPACIVFLLLAASARAEWADVKQGMDQPTVMQALGAPILMNKGKAGAEVWTYDRRGYIQFQYGRVMWWDASRPDPRAAAPTARKTEAPLTHSSEKKATPAGKSAGSEKTLSIL